MASVATSSPCANTGALVASSASVAIAVFAFEVAAFSFGDFLVLALAADCFLVVIVEAPFVSECLAPDLRGRVT
jgi:hypothetical protein